MTMLDRSQARFAACFSALILACAVAACASTTDAQPPQAESTAGTSAGGATAGRAGAAGANAGGIDPGTAGSENESEAGAADALVDPDLETPEEQAAIVSRTEAMAEPSAPDAAATAVARDAIEGPPPPVPAATLGYYECAQKGAALAYPKRRGTDPAVCEQSISSAASTNKLLLASRRDGLLIAFAGTQLSFTHPGDLLRDLESQAVLAHHNPLFEHSDSDGSTLPRAVLDHSLGSVGRGWEARWRSQLKEANHGALYKILKELANTAEYAATDSPSASDARVLTVSVVGHSLGAVVAELAAYDIYDYLRAKNVRFAVRVVAFNPPKIGTEAFVSGYRYRLTESPAQQTFSISQFSRDYDGVPKVPVLLSHPVWNVDGTKVIGDGSDGSLPYCPQYQLSGFHSPLAAHSIDAWATDIPAMAQEAACLFGSRFSAADF